MVYRRTPYVNRRFARPALVLLVALLALAGCGGASLTQPTQSSPPETQFSALVRALAPAQTCTNTFIAHTLDHTTIAGEKVVPLFESNGSGLAIGDLDADGDQDIVLANLREPNTILWNQGSLAFRTQRLSHGESRAASIVDVDGDGRLDIVFTRHSAKPTYWHNTGMQGDARFVQGDLPDVNNPFYSINWGDLDADGDLDLVAGSYDTELLKQQGAIFNYHGGGVGVFVYTHEGERFVAQRLSKQADTLALVLPDLNADGRPDILAGNDFTRPDYAWLQADNGWVSTTPFEDTSENTMSLDVGDIDNDGSPEIFATDMKPYDKDVRTMANWLPMMRLMSHPTSSADVQTTENVLHVREANGRFDNQAYERFADATGWSWSSKFGDLDNDGFLDIYAVNGMIADGLFSHLPGDELVEENRALRNDGSGYFVLAPGWELGLTASGRGMSMADLDDDGDLDIVVNNLQSPAQLFENRLCGGAGLEVDLRWPASKNPYAIGARLALHTSAGTYYRDVRAVSGYLSGDSARIHFGVPAGAVPQRLEVRWPDGAESSVYAPATQTLVTVTRE
ncbi:MAG TPA: CRTAC1 family protein [Roseiflexaceae bacterium]|nr:CRTAC1 family protein [Roseiflexaceae bacterium]